MEINIALSYSTPKQTIDIARKIINKRSDMLCLEDNKGGDIDKKGKKNDGNRTEYPGNVV